MHPMLNIAIRAARKAGDLAAQYYVTTDAVESNQKSTHTYISHLISAIERVILDVISKFYPLTTILDKNTGELIGENQDVQWIIESLNGIENFIKHLPQFTVSLAVRIKGRTEVAVIYDPMRNELFSASRGQGAQLNGQRMRGSNYGYLTNSVLAIDFPFKNKENKISYLALLKKTFEQSVDLRCSGAITLDMAYVAAGRLDGILVFNYHHPWKLTGSELLIREAGGLVTDFTGGHKYFLSGDIVAGNTKIVKSIISLITMNNKCTKY